MSVNATRFQLLLGFLCIYIVWGSTYLAIRTAVHTIPPFLMAGARFLVAGTLLYGWSRVRGAPRPTRLQWRNAAIIGALLLLVGNGCVSWAEQHVDSGMTSLLVATVPLWLVLGEVMQGRRPSWLQWVGVAVGLVGVGVLVMPSSGDTSPHVDPLGAAVLILGSIAWAAGSLFAQAVPSRLPASMNSGMQMICGGMCMMLTSLALGEWSRVDVSAISASSAWAVVYLIIFGSIVGFSTYVWLLSVASPAAVGTYAYVNPLVAVFLGVVVAGETLPKSATIAMFIIVASVALVSLAPYVQRRAFPPVEVG